MKNNKANEGLGDDIATAIGAGGLGVPKSMIAGYFIAKFLHNKKSAREEKAHAEEEAKIAVGIEKVRISWEQELNELERKSGRTRQFLEKLEAYEEQFGPRQRTSFDTLKGSPTDTTVPQERTREVSGLLWVAIFFMPYIFGWLTFRKGYANSTRVVCIIWMIVGATIVAKDIGKNMTGHVMESSESKKPTTQPLIIEPSSLSQDDKAMPTTNSHANEDSTNRSIAQYASARPTEGLAEPGEVVLPKEEHQSASLNSLQASNSPSFDCEKASSSVENLICSSSVLSAADVKLSQAYKNAIGANSNRHELQREQNLWRKNFRDKCTDEKCVLQAYQTRTEELEQRR